MTRNLLVIAGIFILAYITAARLKTDLPAKVSPAEQAALEKLLSAAGFNLQERAANAALWAYVEHWFAVALALAALFVVAGLAWKKP